MKTYHWRPLEQANKIIRFAPTPAGIFAQGRRETNGKSQGWSSGGPGGKERLRLGELKAVPNMAASPTLRWRP